MNISPERCTVIEMNVDAQGEYVGEPQDLLPWADPYISSLLTKHRLESALKESSEFERDQYAARFRRKETVDAWERRSQRLLPSANYNWPREDRPGFLGW